MIVLSYSDGPSGRSINGKDHKKRGGRRLPVPQPLSSSIDRLRPLEVDDRLDVCGDGPGYWRRRRSRQARSGADRRPRLRCKRGRIVYRSSLCTPTLTGLRPSPPKTRGPASSLSLPGRRSRKSEPRLGCRCPPASWTIRCSGRGAAGRGQSSPAPGFGKYLISLLGLA